MVREVDLIERDLERVLGVVEDAPKATLAEAGLRFDGTEAGHAIRVGGGRDLGLVDVEGLLEELDLVLN